MAAEIKPVLSPHAPKNVTPERPILITRIDSSGAVSRDCRIVSKGETIFTVCDDKTFRIWQRRESGQYWPSVCHSLPSTPYSLYYEESSRKLFIGLENGTVTEYAVSNDFNSVKHVRDYLGHQNVVVSVIYASLPNWVISISRDKFMVYHCTLTGKRLGGHECENACTALQFDQMTNHVFIGEQTGSIVMLKLEESCYHMVTTLKGHSGSVRCLAWDPIKKFLYSGSYDRLIIVWDIGGGQGTFYELQGHEGNVTSLKYLPNTKKLVSGGDVMIIFWDMNITRVETAKWAEADSCQYCDAPFIWNVRDMVNKKQFGQRQHHCRKCGKALCDSCSSRQSNLPKMGFEYEVRMCNPCFETITENDRKTTTRFQEVKHTIVALDCDEDESILVTLGQDKAIKVWSASTLLS